MENFELQFSGKANDVIPVLKYKSNKTGLTVVIAQVGGPLVNGYFCLATEAFDDDGLPHTLEHLVFMGSEEYPYKGVLDLLANRCLASGTNAWTDTDHTCYTMTTAGSEGFLNLLPIYLDHVLYPTLTESAYVTEVHHVNGEGEDAGVVYCEMQARENSGESRTHLAMLRAMYPGQCGYKSETGGIMENLRISTSHKKVCDYHKEFYRPENLCLVITGQVKPEDIFAALKPFEDKIVKKGSRPLYTRPWQGTVPELPKTVEQIVPYPSDEEEQGMVSVTWRGPKAKDQYQVNAILMLMEYLTDTAVAPLQRDFVEVEDPLCGNVKYSIIENSETCVYISFQNTSTEKLGEVKEKLMALLNKISRQEEKLDMERMGHVVHRRVLEAMSNLEDQPHDTLAFMVIGDFLYGGSNEELDERLNQLESFKKLGKENQSFWLTLLNNYFINQKTVTIIGEPSKKLMEEMGKGEKDRVKAQAEKLGKDGLKAKSDRLAKATEDNEEEPPQEMLTKVDVPSVESIHFHSIKPSSNATPETANSNGAFPLKDIPITFQLDDIQTNFVMINVLFDTSCIPDDLKMYMPLYLETLLESAIVRKGKTIPHEKIIAELAADTVENGSGIGVGGHRFTCGQFSQCAYFTIKLEADRYKKGVQWVRELLYQVKFTPERVKVVASKMVKDISRLKRSGRYVVQALNKAILYNKESNHFTSSFLKQQKFLKKAMEQLGKKDTSKEVIEALDKLKHIATKPNNVRVHLSIHVDSISKQGPPQDTWIKDLIPKGMDTAGKRPTIKPDHEFITSYDNGHSQSYIAGIGSVESAFLIQSAPCVKSFTHEDLPAILVYIQFLTQLEGPMWRQIRGLGLSYHYSMYVKAETGLIYFILYKSTAVSNAYKVGKEIVDGYLSGKTPYSEVELETCKSSLIFEIIEEEKTPSDASVESILSYFRGVGQDYNRSIIQKIPKVTIADLTRVGPKYIAPLFDVKQSRCAVVCHPTKVEEVCKGFKEISRELTVIDSLEDSFLA